MVVLCGANEVATQRPDGTNSEIGKRNLTLYFSLNSDQNFSAIAETMTG